MVKAATGREWTKTAMTLVGRQSASRAMPVAERCRFAFWGRRTRRRDAARNALFDHFVGLSEPVTVRLAQVFC
jgi:hypothetical protein